MGLAALTNKAVRRFRDGGLATMMDTHRAAMAKQKVRKPKKLAENMDDTKAKLKGLSYFSDDGINAALNGRYWDDIGKYRTTPKGNYKMVYMHPDDFLRMSARFYKTPRVKSLEENLGKVRSGKEKINHVPWLEIDFMNEGVARVWQHSGRHRALTLSKKGVQRMPVLLRTRGQRAKITGRKGKDLEVDIPKYLQKEFNENDFYSPTNAGTRDVYMPFPYKGTLRLNK